MTNKKYDVLVSDHAVIRYMERVMGLNLDKIRQEILPKEKYDLVKDFSEVKVKLDTHTAVVCEGQVVTVLTPIMTKPTDKKGLEHTRHKKHLKVKNYRSFSA